MRFVHDPAPKRHLRGWRGSSRVGTGPPARPEPTRDNPMNATVPVLHDRVQAVLALAATSLDAAMRQKVEAVAQDYFRRLEAEDLTERSPEDLLGALVSHLTLGEQRSPGELRLRIFTPGKADGWATRHSVIQLVNDDMPLLVDSSSLEINRQGHTLHLIL